MNDLTPKGRERLTIPRMIAGILDLACKAREDAVRAGGFVKVFTREDDFYVSKDFANGRLGLPDFEEIRMIMGLASPQLVTEVEQQELVDALEDLRKAGEKLHRIVRRDYYSEKNTLPLDPA